MDIRSLRYFTEVVQMKGFSRAADALYVTQPAISRSILRLENELGLKLLIREPEGVRMTEEGVIFFNHAKQILAQFDSMKKAMEDKSGPLTGTLNVGLPPIIASTYFAGIIMTFTTRYPNIELKIFELGTEQVLKAMIEGNLETAAVMLPFDNSRFDLHPFISERLTLLVNNRHYLATRDEVSFRELIDEKFVLFAENYRINELIHDACGIYNRKPAVVGRSNHLDLIIAMVSAGVGITLLPDSIGRIQLIDGLAMIKINDPVLSYDIALANIKGYQSRNSLAWNELAQQMLGILNKNNPPSSER